MAIGKMNLAHYQAEVKIEMDAFILLLICVSGTLHQVHF